LILDSPKENIVENKAFEFAIRIVELYKYLSIEKKEFVLSKQLLRAGTSIGANIAEAQAAQSRKDFIAKLSIASKEARESHYWLRLLKATGYLSKDDLLIECDELVRLLTSIVKTTQSRV